jgi:hypothetical protein
VPKLRKRHRRFGNSRVVEGEREEREGGGHRGQGRGVLLIPLPPPPPLGAGGSAQGEAGMVAFARACASFDSLDRI